MHQIWTLPASISSALRRPALSAAGRFLGRGVILEPGCGAGWPGRLLLQVDKDIRIVGSDISEEQLALAREGAAAEGVADRADYRQAEMRQLDLGEFDGVFVHAALHHLSDDEVREFLDVLVAGPAGLRVVFYEPVFIHRVPWLPRFASAVLCRAIAGTRRVLVPRQLAYDERVLAELDALEREAEREGWFFSPKEVPFERNALMDELVRRFDVAFAHPVHFDAIEVAQKLAMIRDGGDKERLIRTVLRRVLRFDQLILRTGAYRACDGRYAFWLIGVVLRGGATSAAATASAA